FFFFFFQAEDGIRDRNVTGVQTCALPICLRKHRIEDQEAHDKTPGQRVPTSPSRKGRESSRAVLDGQVHILEPLAKPYLPGSYQVRFFPMPSSPSAQRHVRTLDVRGADRGLSLKDFYPSRSSNARKGDFGRVIVCGGSDRYAGCLAFNSLAALGAGADLAIVVAPRRAADIVSGYSPDLITVPCDSSFPDPNIAIELLEN